MTDDQPEVSRKALQSWRRRSDAVASERNPLVSAAIEAGLSKEEVHVITGLGRNTINRILAQVSRS